MNETSFYILKYYRSYIVALCIVTVLWIPVVKAAQGGQLFTYIVVVEGFIAAPLPILFLFAVFWDRCTEKVIIEPRHEISNNVVSATSKASVQPAHLRSLIRAFAYRLNILRLLNN